MSRKKRNLSQALLRASLALRLVNASRDPRAAAAAVYSMLFIILARLQTVLTRLSILFICNLENQSSISP